MNKRKLAKKLVLSKETLRKLEPGELQKAAGQGSWESDCQYTCGENSCLGVCTLNCSWLCGTEEQ
jgi:hypothetical protein